MINITCKSPGWETIEKGQGFLFENKMYVLCEIIANRKGTLVEGIVEHLVLDVFCLSDMLRSTIKVPEGLGREMIVLIDIKNIDYELRQ